MCRAIDNPTCCKIRAVIYFLYIKNMSVIHLELCAVCCQGVRSEGTVRQLCGMLEDGQTNIHDKERVSAICSDLV
jgi:hypothetical protein